MLTLFPLVSAILVFGLAFFIFLVNFRSKVNLYFTFFAFLIGSWLTGSYFLINSCGNDNNIIFWDRLIYIFVVFIPAVTYHFSVVFTGKEKQKKIFTIALYLISFSFLILSKSDYFLSGVFHYKYGCHLQSGFLHNLFIVFFGVAIALALFNLFKYYKITDNEVKKVQAFFIFLALFILATLGSLAFLPAYNISVYPIVYFSGFITAGIIAYAILKHRLFNIKTIAAELFTFALWIAILVKIFLVDNNKEKIIDAGFLVYVSIFGIFLIRSVLKEVRAREKIEELATKLEFANLRLKQLDEAKSDFLSIASHQLRTPLTAIKGYASMILEGSYGKISETTKSAVDKIFQSSQRLVLIIGDFLDISHIEQGTMQYDFAALDVRELAKGLTDEFKATIESSTDKSKALKISFEADEKENFSVNADRNKIRQVVSNLIDNSIKYTPAGFVKVSLSKIAENGNVLLKIEDSGIGISAETMPNLFKKFGRARSLSSAYANGSGLGLYVAKEIIKAHKGKIWAESEGEGKGSKFFVELPGK